jgi:TRAP-type mannitol/chloroaromatic compound transport system substrate-binding protein
MQRRQLITNLGLGITGSTILTACQSQTRFTTSQTEKVEQPDLNWDLKTNWPENSLIYNGIIALCDRLAQVTNGKFKITPTPGGNSNILNDVKSRKVECGHTAGYYHIDKNPALAFSSSMPFGLNTKQQVAWLTAGGGLELTRKAYSDFNVINFPAGTCGNTLGGWFKQEINSIEELKSLKLSIPGLGGEVLKTLGVGIENLPFGELVTGLEQNKISGAQYLTPDDGEKLGLNKVAPYYYYPGWQSPGLTFDLIVNLKAWEKLPLNYQQALETVCLESVGLMFAKYENADSEVITKLTSGGTELKEFPTEVLNTIYEATQAFYSDTANKNTTFKEIYTQWQDFYKTIFAWYRIDELSYADFVFK